MALRLCRNCSDWHDLSEPWPEECSSHFRGASTSGIQVVKDIEPYRSVITREVIGGRKQHRDHLKAHGCIEVGNDFGKPKQPEYLGGLGQDIKRAMEIARAR